MRQRVVADLVARGDDLAKDHPHVWVGEVLGDGEEGGAHAGAIEEVEKARDAAGPSARVMAGGVESTGIAGAACDAMDALVEVEAVDIDVDRCSAAHRELERLGHAAPIDCGSARRTSGGPGS